LLLHLIHLTSLWTIPAGASPRRQDVPSRILSHRQESFEPSTASCKRCQSSSRGTAAGSKSILIAFYRHWVDQGRLMTTVTHTETSSVEVRTRMSPNTDQTPPLKSVRGMKPHITGTPFLDLGKLRLLRSNASGHAIPARRALPLGLTHHTTRATMHPPVSKVRRVVIIPGNTNKENTMPKLGDLHFLVWPNWVVAASLPTIWRYG
jgi:hypothetical protein